MLPQDRKTLMDIKRKFGQLKDKHSRNPPLPDLKPRSQGRTVWKGNEGEIPEFNFSTFSAQSHVTDVYKGLQFDIRAIACMHAKRLIDQLMDGRMDGKMDGGWTEE